MYIKRLEIVGFKSFPERALVPLSPGISAVVGPNGCGKSNIIDAIRWVMGEQSPKMLRGRNMDDILFNGSQNKPGSALAEVTLTLARDRDVEQGFPTAAETSVTRRLYRSGDSEYLINRVPSRLKDVVHFFTDHGVGTRAYGIIEQGRVGWLVDARPEERRGLIDEAAGITRYKQQKKEAERKIESAEANLVNVSVIKAETKKQLDQITRAAAKAARYKALKEELRTLDLGLSARELVAGRDRRRELTAGREENRRLLTFLLTEADRHELELENLKLAAAQTERELEDKSTAWHQLTAARDGALKEIEFNRSRQVRSGEARGRVLEELARLASERRRKMEEEARLSVELAELESADDEARRRTDDLREEWRALKAAFESLSRERDQADRRRSEAEKQAADLTAQLAGAESLLGHHRSRLESLTAESLAADELSTATEAKLADLTAQKDGHREALEAAEEQRAYQAEAALLAERELARAAEAVAAAEKKLSGLAARLETLRGVKDNFGWYPQGVKALMADPGLRAAGLLGPLAEHLAIPDGYEDAAEAALGERLAWLLATDRNAALNALDFLEKNKLGRCGFLCRDELGSDLSRSLLGDFRLAEDLSGADASPASGSGPASILTRNGRYAGGGLVAGGRPGDGPADAGLLARLKEVEELERRVAELEAELSALRSSHSRAAETLEETREALRTAEAARAVAARRLEETDKALILLGSEAAQARSRRESLQKEKEKTETSAAELTASLAEGRRKREEAQSAAEAAAAQALNLKDSLAERGEELEELRGRGEEARLAAATAAEKLDRARHELSMVNQWLEEVEDQLAGREAEAAALAEELAALTESATELEERAAAFPQLLAAAEEDLSAARARLEEARRRQSGRETEAREIRRRREDLNSILSGQETDLMAVQFKLDKVEEDLRRDWHIIMPDFAALPPPVETPESVEDQQVPDNQQEGVVSEQLPDDDAPALVDAESEATENAAPEPIGDTVENPEEWAAVELPEGAAGRRDTLRVKIGSLGEV
ncbi:MAG: chromosome segregation protein SMC, partial [Candidatus Adiutrix sp.]|nr:chromosome segregation protein SMC [Candidatus Adiutrix sp.]